MKTSRTLAVSATVLALLAVSACGGGNDKTADKKVDKPGQPAVKASWGTAAVPMNRLRNGTTADFDAALPQGEAGPYLLVGETDSPDGAGKVTAWTSADGNSWPHARSIAVDGDADVYGAVADGKRTIAYGGTWSAGKQQSWLRTSTDRASWKSADVPSDFTAAGALASTVVPLEGNGILLVGVDKAHDLVGESVGGSKLVTLPAAPGKARYDNVEAAARNGSTVVVIAGAQATNGTRKLVGLRSTDGGSTWSEAGAPEGASATIGGIVVAGDRFVTTGWTGGAVSSAAAWSSKDGKAWTREDLPAMPGADLGWSNWAGTPAVLNGKVYASANTGAQLYGNIYERDGGHWRLAGQSGNWVAPGVEAQIAPGNKGIVVARSDNGRATIGLQQSSYQSTKSLGTDEATGYWGTPSSLGGAPLLPYQHQIVSADGDAWTQSSATRQLSFSAAGKVAVTGFQPPQAKKLVTPGTASAPDGSTVVMGTLDHNHPAQGDGDDTDVAGWYRAKGGKWQPLTGLAGPRTEQFGAVRRVGDQWVAVGYDRADFDGSKHEFGAVWTSSNGHAWKRSNGPFDVNPSFNSQINDACTTPDGRVLVVGGTDDPTKGSVAKAWRQHGSTWTPVDLSGLGKGVSEIDSCVGTGKVTLLQGTTVTGPGVWRTSNLTSYDKVTIGGENDTVGTVRPVSGGFAAAGLLGDGNLSQPVVWLSKDGDTWTSTAVPVERQTYASDVIQWGKRLVVLLDGDSGPAVRTLDNFGDVLGAS